MAQGSRAQGWSRAQGSHISHPTTHYPSYFLHSHFFHYTLHLHFFISSAPQTHHTAYVLSVLHTIGSMAWWVQQLGTWAWETDWAGWAEWAGERGRSAYAFSSSFPRDCRAATAQTALVCAGYAPEHTMGPPSFGSFALRWGWLVAGILIGVAFMIARCR